MLLYVTVSSNACLPLSIVDWCYNMRKEWKLWTKHLASIRAVLLCSTKKEMIEGSILWAEWAIKGWKWGEENYDNFAGIIRENYQLMGFSIYARHLYDSDSFVHASSHYAHLKYSGIMVISNDIYECEIHLLNDDSNIGGSWCENLQVMFTFSSSIFPILCLLVYLCEYIRF